MVIKDLLLDPQFESLVLTLSAAIVAVIVKTKCCKKDVRTSVEACQDDGRNQEEEVAERHGESP